MHTFCFSALLHCFALMRPKLGNGQFVLSLLGLCVFGTPAMMLAMSPCQILQLRIENGVATQLPGRPDLNALLLEIFLLSAIALIFSRGKPTGPPSFLRRSASMDKKLWLASVLYFACLAGVMAVGDPAAVVAEGVHQDYGACGIPDVDLSNYPRFKYLCKKSFDEDFHFDCAEGRAQKLPPRIASWYTLCGKAHSNHELYLATVVGLGMAASFALAKMLLAPKTGGGGRGSTKGIKMEYSKKTM